jgi:type IV secretory pathway VirB10-like protein
MQQGSRADELWRRWGGLAVGAVVLAALIAFIWYMLAGTASTKREVAATPMLMLPPEPIKPPEPEKLPDPPPEKIKPEVQEPKPSPVDAPKDQAPTPSQNVADPLTMNADPQAGIGGILAGSGGGMVGGGGMAGSYGRYVANAMQQALARDERTRHLAFDDITFDLWLDANGKVVRTVLVTHGSSAKVDELLLTVLGDFRSDERPGPNIRFPMRVAIKGRRP